MELKRYSPVPVHGDGPAPLFGSLEWMKSETWNVHILDGLSGIQGGQLHSQAFGVGRLNARYASQLKELLQALVSER